MASPSFVDTPRLRALIRAHGPALKRGLGRLGVASADVDDALQEVFVVAASRLATIPLEAERSFLFATAKRVASNARRGQKRRFRTHEGLGVVPAKEVATPEDTAHAVREKCLVDETIERMPMDLQSVFVLFEIEGAPSDEIAQSLDIPEGTVASRLRRARECFEREIERVSRRRSLPIAAKPKKADRDFSLELCTWWVSNGEVDALQAFLRMCKIKHPNLDVTHAAFSGTDAARKRLRSRMDHGAPPDTFQVNAGTDLSSWVGHSGVRQTMESLDFLAASEGWSRSFPRDVLDLVIRDGHVYAVPVDIHRTNVLYSNKRIFAEHGLPIPKSLSDFFSVSEILRGRGVTPFAIGLEEPWTLTNLACESVLVAEAGVDHYREFFSGKKRPSDSALASAVAQVGRMLDYANADAHELTWSRAVDLVRTGQAAMTIAGDWANGYLMQMGAKPGEDFTETASPGASGAFVYSVDAFGLPTRASHPSETIELLRAFGSREGQLAFNPIKGSIPARLDADVSRCDLPTQAKWQAFHAIDRVPSLACLAPASFTRALDRAMAKFAVDRDVSSVTRAVSAHYHLLTPAAERAHGQPVN